MKMRRFLALFVTALLLLTSFALPAPFSAVRETEASTSASTEVKTPPEKKTEDSGEPKATSGKCGPNLTWSFNTSTGALTITGSGEMYDYYDDDNPPWFENGFYDKITSLSLPKGLTYIGAWGFWCCTALTSVTIPANVKTIGTGAFAYDESIRIITIPKKVTAINSYAFYECYGLKTVSYQGKVDDRVKIRLSTNGNEYLLNATWNYAKPNTAKLAIKTQPKSVKVNEGKTATFKVKVAGATTIRWQYRPAGESNWYDLSVLGDSLSVTGSYLYDGYAFRCVVSNGTATLTSNAATLSVKLVPLVIKTHPKTVKANVGKTVTFKVKANGASHYDWQAKWPGESTWYSQDYDSDTFTFTARAEYDGIELRCAVSNDRGETKYSNAGKLCVTIKITKKPKAVKVAAGELAYFTVEGSGYTGVQWQYMWPGEKVWRDVGGGVYETCTIQTQASYNGVVFRAKLYNNTSVKYTSKAKLTVTKATGSTTSSSNRALLIGENTYSSSPLNGCVNDMNAMAGMLRGLGNGFTTTTLPNSTKSQIMNAISTAYAGATSSSTSVFYYSGHGVNALDYASDYPSVYDTYHGALCPIDCDNGAYITFKELANALSQVPGRVVVILDSCHSGASIGKEYVSNAEMKRLIDEYNKAAIEAFSGYYLESEDGAKVGELATSKFVVITAASSDQSSWDGRFDGSSYPQGRFTAAFIKGMGCTYPSGSYSGSMPADANKDKKITLKEIYNYAYSTALNWGSTAQYAQYYGDLSEVLFTR